MKLFDIDHTPHVPYRPGDRIRFERLQACEWDDWVGTGRADKLAESDPR